MIMESFTKMPVLTPGGSFLSVASNPRRDDGDGRDDIFGGTPRCQKYRHHRHNRHAPHASPVPTMKSAEFSVDKPEREF